MSHTPGPWTIEEYGDDHAPSLVIHKDSESRVCFMATPGSHGDPATIEADARLIAAAPDLLEALKQIREWLLFKEHLTDPKGLWNEAFREANNAANAAIAKATGEING